MDHLVLDQFLAESLTFPSVFNRRVDHPVEARQAVRGGPEAFLLELHHLHLEAHALLPHDVAGRNADIVEEQGRRVGRVHADLVDLVPFYTRTVHRHHDEGFVGVAAIRLRRIDQQTTPVSHHPIGDPGLRPIDDIVIPIPPRSRLDIGHIRASRRLGHANATDRVARDRGAQKLFSQFG